MKIKSLWQVSSLPTLSCSLFLLFPSPLKYFPLLYLWTWRWSLRGFRNGLFIVKSQCLLCVRFFYFFTPFCQQSNFFLRPQVKVFSRYTTSLTTAFSPHSPSRVSPHSLLSYCLSTRCCILAPLSHFYYLLIATFWYH